MHCTAWLNLSLHYINKKRKSYTKLCSTLIIYIYTKNITYPRVYTERSRDVYHSKSCTTIIYLQADCVTDLYSQVILVPAQLLFFCHVLKICLILV